MGSTGPAFFNIVKGERRSGSQVDRGIDPRTEEPLWETPVASAADLDEAVAAARAALPAWAATPLVERQKALARMADVLNENSAELVQIVMKETGKSQLMASVEIKNTSDQFLYYSKKENVLQDEVQFEDETVKIVATHQPVGVVGAICPWNFPLILSSIKVVAALVMGNPIIIKPSPFTPYSALKLAELVQPLVPAGVVQALGGDGELGRLMTEHAGVDKISFTGSIATGKRVAAACARSLKKVTLELGGNDAAVVCRDVAVPEVAAQVAAGAYFNAGQVCVATKRVYVHEDVYDAFLERFVAETRTAYAGQVGADGVSVPTIFGPVSNKMQFDKVKGVLEDVGRTGGEVLTGGAPHDGAGYWIQPTVVAQPPEDSLLVQEEQFGPVVPIMKWSSEDDVIKRANLTNSGLGATVYSKDLERAERIARRLECGSVWINMPEKPNVGAWMGGWKDSGFGGEMGKLGLYAYCNIKSLHFAK